MLDLTTIRPIAGWLIPVLMIAGLGHSRAIADDTQGTVRAGVARVDITPTDPVTLSGYESRKGLSKGVHDPLSARVVAFEEGGHRLVLISTDLIGFYDGSHESLRKAILDACQLQPSELLLTAIHTHSAPGVTFDADKGHPNNVAYSRGLETKLVAVVRDALTDLAPVRLAVGSGSSPVGVNRREVVVDAAGKSQIVLGRNPAVLTDREVQVLELAPPGDGGPRAILFAYATHSTSLGPGNELISGDVHGLAEQFIEAHLGRGVIAPAFAGASGDIDPWYRVLPRFETENGWVPEPLLQGTMLGEEVVRVTKGLHPQPARGPVATLTETLDLPAQPSAETVGPAVGSTQALTITVGRVGEVAFVGLGCEAFNAVGKAIKVASPFATTIILTHCNGAAGYLPTRDAYPAGGYEIRSSHFAPGAAETVVEEAAALLRKLRPGEPRVGKAIGLVPVFMGPWRREVTAGTIPCKSRSRTPGRAHLLHVRPLE